MSPATGVANLVDVVHVMAQNLYGIDIGSEVFCQFTCNEIESVTDVLRAVGEDEVADQIIRWHGEGDDDPGDQHHEFYDPNHRHH